METETKKPDSKASIAFIHKHYWTQLVRSHSLSDVNISIVRKDEEALTASDDHIAWDVFSQHIKGALDEGAGVSWLLETASQLNPATHGPLGLAALCAETVAEAVKIIAMHATSRQTVLTLKLEQLGDGKCRMDFVPNIERSELYDLFESATLLNVVNIISNMASPLPDESLTITCVCDVEPLQRTLNAMLANATSYGQQKTSITFSGHCLTLPSVYADRTTCDANVLKCYKDKILDTEDNRDIKEKVLSLIDDYFSIRRLEQTSELPATAAPSVESVASQLCLSSRTLHRRLQATGTSFKSIWQQARQKEAENCLSRSELNISEIAELIGYRDTGNFIRAFKQWNQQSPSQWRNQQRNK